MSLYVGIGSPHAIRTMQKRFIFLLGALFLVIVLFTIVVIKGRGGSNVPAALTQPMTLKYWRVFDQQDDFASIIAAYRALHPHVTIEYRQFTYEEYEDALLRGWAKGAGPDILSIQNSWVKKYVAEGFLAPLPPSTQVAEFKAVRALGIRPEIRVSAPVKPSLTLADIQNNFMDVVGTDVVVNNAIYGLPLTVDTLALYYNKTLLTQAKIPLPATGYTELYSEHLPRLKKESSTGEILQSAIAMGTADNITRSQDILLLLMMQNLAQTGLPLVDARGQYNFLAPSPANAQEIPAKNAFDFYTSFASPTRESYTWNADLPLSLNAFVEGRVAYMFGYAYHKAQIEQQSNGTLEFGVAPLPQLDKEVNMANYWVEAVAASSPNTNTAWDFVQFATRADNALTYLTKTKKPTALKALVETQKQDPFLSIFVDQALLAQNWYHGYEPRVAEQYVREAITSVNEGKATMDAALELLNRQLLSTYTPPSP